MPKYTPLYEMESFQFSIGSPLRHRLSIVKCYRFTDSVRSCFCKGIHMTIVADHLDNNGFKAIAMSSLLESMYLINQEEEHPFKWTSRLQCCHYLYMGLFALCLFLWLYSICVLFVMTVLQSCPVLCYFCEVWILPGQFVTLYINCKPKPWMLLPSDLHCKWQIVGLVKTVVTRWNGLVCRVQLTIFQNWVR